jgi:hypothetical protein
METSSKRARRTSPRRKAKTHQNSRSARPQTENNKDDPNEQKMQVRYQKLAQTPTPSPAFTTLKYRKPPEKDWLIIQHKTLIPPPPKSPPSYRITHEKKARNTKPRRNTSTLAHSEEILGLLTVRTNLLLLPYKSTRRPPHSFFLPPFGGKPAKKTHLFLEPPS